MPPLNSGVVTEAGLILLVAASSYGARVFPNFGPHSDFQFIPLTPFGYDTFSDFLKGGMDEVIEVCIIYRLLKPFNDFVS